MILDNRWWLTYKGKFTQENPTWMKTRFQIENLLRSRLIKFVPIVRNLFPLAHTTRIIFQLTTLRPYLICIWISPFSLEKGRRKGKNYLLLFPPGIPTTIAHPRLEVSLPGKSNKNIFRCHANLFSFGKQMGNGTINTKTRVNWKTNTNKPQIKSITKAKREVNFFQANLQR